MLRQIQRVTFLVEDLVGIHRRLPYVKRSVGVDMGCSRGSLGGPWRLRVVEVLWHRLHGGRGVISKGHRLNISRIEMVEASL